MKGPGRVCQLFGTRILEGRRKIAGCEAFLGVPQRKSAGELAFPAKN